MSSNLPQAANDYAAPTTMELSRAVWDSVFLSISNRLKALELTSADYDAAILQLETQALAVISNTITTEIDAQRATLQQIEADFAEVQQAFNEVLSGGVSASVVSTSGIAGLTATNLAAALAELIVKIEANTTAIGEVKTVKFIDLTQDTDLVAGEAYRLRGVGLTHNLPISPAVGDTIRIVDGEVILTDATVTIARNGNTIRGLNENLVIDTPGIDFLIWWNGSDWRLF